MGLILCFIFGVINFASHKAVMESGHPFVEDTKLYFSKHFGKNSGYILEFLILLGVMAFHESMIFVGIYMIYSIFNLITAYLLVQRKL